MKTDNVLYYRGHDDEKSGFVVIQDVITSYDLVTKKMIDEHKVALKKIETMDKIEALGNFYVVDNPDMATKMSKRVANYLEKYFNGCCSGSMWQLGYK